MSEASEGLGDPRPREATSRGDRDRARRAHRDSCVRETATVDDRRGGFNSSRAPGASPPAEGGEHTEVGRESGGETGLLSLGALPLGERSFEAHREHRREPTISRPIRPGAPAVEGRVRRRRRPQFVASTRRVIRSAQRRSTTGAAGCSHRADRAGAIEVEHGSPSGTTRISAASKPPPLARRRIDNSCSLHSSSPAAQRVDDAHYLRLW